MAGGFSIKKNKVTEFEDFIIKNYEKTKLDVSKGMNLYLDSTIAPSALNEDFYNKINILAPFGSGNNEPKFMIENLNLINSQIVGLKHIKAILKGKDGTVFNTFTANAKDSPLEPFLTTKNKNINIAGKMKLNEWSGEKKIEFIIEDISINQVNHPN